MVPGLSAGHVWLPGFGGGLQDFALGCAAAVGDGDCGFGTGASAGAGAGGRYLLFVRGGVDGEGGGGLVFGRHVCLCLFVWLNFKY